MDPLETIRTIIRKDLQGDTVGLIPTGKGIQLASNGDPAVLYGLMCEAVFVAMFSGRDLERTTGYLQYLGRSMAMPDEVTTGFLLTAQRTWAVLHERTGDHNAAYRELMGDKGADAGVVKAVVTAGVRTAREFSVPWERDFSAFFASAESAQPAALGVVAAFLLIAGADGDLDQKELKAAAGIIMAKANHPTLGAIFLDAGRSMPAYAQQLLGPGSSPQALFGALTDACRAVREQHGPQALATFKTQILELATAVASASGGLFGFGSKIDKQEEAMIEAIAHALRSVK